MLDRCPNCPSEFKPIAGCGEDPCPVLLLGERPGRTEEQRGRVFVGKTGEELDFTYLPLARLRRPDVRIENVVRCWAVGNRQPTDKEVDSCANHFLPRILDACRPEVVVLMGGTAHKIVDHVEGQRRIRVDTMHGRPFYGSLLNGTWEGWIWSSYHPALGMHDTAKMTDLLDDFERFRQWRRGEWTPPVPPEVGKDYGLVDNQESLSRYLKIGKKFAWPSEGPTVQLFTDTERHGPMPWSAQFSTHPHSARMLRWTGDTSSRRLFEQLAWWIKETQAEVVLHNAGQDQDMLDAMGVPTPLFRDTQQEAFQLCSLPQGLKPLAYRLLGVTMRSWEDTVWPASVDAISEWMVDAIDLASGHLADVKTSYMKTYSCAACGHRAHAGKTCASKAGGAVVKCGCTDGDRFSNAKHERRPAAVEKILRHVLGFTSRTADADEPYNPWKKLPEMLQDGLRGAKAEEWEMEWLVEKLGPVPILGIANCDLAEAVEYGNSDADNTGLVAAELARLREDPRWEIAEGDQDA